MFDNILNKIDITNIKYTGYSRLFDELFIKPDYLKTTINNQKKLNKNIFIIIFHSHLKIFLSIGPKLKEEKVPFSIITVRDKFTKELRDYKKDIFSLTNAFSLFDLIKATLNQLLIIFYYYFSNKNKLNATLKFYKIHYFLKITIVRLLKKFKTKNVILFKGDGVEALTISKTIKDNFPAVKIVAIQHGLILPSKLFSFSKLFVDEYWVWSNFFKKRLLKFNTGCKIDIVGDPTKDVIFKNKSEKTFKSEKTKKILFLPNHGNNHTSKSQVKHSIDVLIKFINSNNDYKLYVKPHPGDINDFVYNNFNKNKTIHIKFIDKHKEINFNSYDLTVINNSTAGMESALNGKPVIIIAENENQVMVKQYLDYGFAELACDYNQFKNCFKKIIKNYLNYYKKTQVFSNEMYDFKGNSINQIINKIK